jgi:hypothetical protein
MDGSAKGRPYPLDMNHSLSRFALLLAAGVLPYLAACGGDMHLGSTTSPSGSTIGLGGATGTGGTSGTTGTSPCQPGDTTSCGQNACGAMTRTCDAQGAWGPCTGSEACLDAGPVECLSTSATFNDFVQGALFNYYQSVAAGSPDRILAALYPPGIGSTLLTQPRVLTMNPDGTGAADGSFFDRGGATVYFGGAVWVDPYFYVLWSEYPALTVWLGRLDHAGQPVGAPLAIGAGLSPARMTASGGEILVARTIPGPQTKFPATVGLDRVDPKAFTVLGTRSVTLAKPSTTFTTAGVARTATSWRWPAGPTIRAAIRRPRSSC